MIPHDDPAFDSEIGLTKREVFAVLMMHGFASNGDVPDAKTALQCADNLLAELNKNK
jgi:hypothetical protein